MQPISPLPANCATFLSHADSYRQQYLLPRPQMCSLTDRGENQGDEGPHCPTTIRWVATIQTSPVFSVSSLGGAIPSSGSMFHNIISHTKLKIVARRVRLRAPKEQGRAPGYPTLQFHTTTRFSKVPRAKNAKCKYRAQADSSQSPRLMERKHAKGGICVLEQLAKLKQSRPRFVVESSRDQGELELQALCQELNPLVVPEARWWSHG